MLSHPIQLLVLWLRRRARRQTDFQDLEQQLATVPQARDCRRAHEPAKLLLVQGCAHQCHKVEDDEADAADRIALIAEAEVEEQRIKMMRFLEPGEGARQVGELGIATLKLAIRTETRQRPR